jgi:hypothetical protein
MKAALIFFSVLVVLSVNSLGLAQESNPHNPAFGVVDGTSPSAVKIEHTWEWQEGNLIYRTTQPSLGTVVGPNVILTHNHFGQLPGAHQNESMTFRGKNGERVQVQYADLETTPVDEGTMLLRLPAGLTLPAAPLADRSVIDRLAAGNWLTVIYWDDVNSRIRQQSFQIAGIENGVVTLADPNRLINKGDSGGGVYYEGQLVGNTWSIHRDTSGNPVGYFNVALLPLQNHPLVIAAPVDDIPAGLETLPADRLARQATLRLRSGQALRQSFGFAQDVAQGRFWLERGIRFEGATWDDHTVGLALTGLGTLLRRFAGDWDKLKHLLGLKANASLVYDDDTSKCPSGRRANCARPWKGRIHFNTSSLTLDEFLHENGHVVDWFLQKERGTPGDWWSTTGLLGLGWTLRSGEAMYDDAERDAPYSQASIQEDFADSFVAWVLGPESPEPYRALSPRRHRALNVAFMVLPE